MPISFTRYHIVEKPGEWTKLFCHAGLLSTSSDETQFYRIDDMRVHQSLFDKMFGVGTIEVLCRGWGNPAPYGTDAGCAAGGGGADPSE